MVAGNHDTPRSAETGCILRLFTPLGVHVVEGEPQALGFPAHDLSSRGAGSHRRPAFLPGPGDGTTC